MLQVKHCYTEHFFISCKLGVPVLSCQVCVCLYGREQETSIREQALPRLTVRTLRQRWQLLLLLVLLLLRGQRPDRPRGDVRPILPNARCSLRTIADEASVRHSETHAGLTQRKPEWTTFQQRPITRPDPAKASIKRTEATPQGACWKPSHGLWKRRQADRTTAKLRQNHIAAVAASDGVRYI